MSDAGPQSTQPWEVSGPRPSQVLAVSSLGRDLFSPGETKPIGMQLCVVLIVFCLQEEPTSISLPLNCRGMDLKTGLFCGLGIGCMIAAGELLLVLLCPGRDW